MPELSQALASLIAGGGTGTLAQIEHMTPKTMSGDWAKVAQWITNEPHGAGQQAFVQNMIETALREREVAQKGVDTVRSQRAAKHQRVLRGNPQESKTLLQGFGWDIDENGSPVLKPQAAPASHAAPAAPQVSAEDQQAIEWLKANPSHPKAAAVAAKLKAKGL
jgi:hypothetical protein